MNLSDGEVFGTSSGLGKVWFATWGEYAEAADEWFFRSFTSAQGPHYVESEPTLNDHPVVRFYGGTVTNDSSAIYDSDNAGLEERTPWSMHGFQRFTFFAHVKVFNNGKLVNPIFHTNAFTNAGGLQSVKFNYLTNENPTPRFGFDIGSDDPPNRLVIAVTDATSAPDDSTWHSFMAVFDNGGGAGVTSTILRLYVDDPENTVGTGNRVTSQEPCDGCLSDYDPYLGTTKSGTIYDGAFDIYAIGWWADTLSLAERTLVFSGVDSLINDLSSGPGESGASGEYSRRRYLRRVNSRP
jgi:hypothetical protein